MPPYDPFHHLAGELASKRGLIRQLLHPPLLPSPPPGAHVLLTPGAAGPSALSAQLASALPPLPAGTQLQDNTLALLHHMALATGTHAAFILSPGTTPLSPANRRGVGGEGPPLMFLMAALSREWAVCALPSPPQHALPLPNCPRKHRTEASIMSALLWFPLNAVLLSPLLPAGYRPTAGSTAESESREGAAVLAEALVSAMQRAGGAASGAVVADQGRSAALSLQNPWFSHEGARSDGMYC